VPVITEEMIMVEFDPGPVPEVADHFEKVPSYATHGITSGTTGDRSSIVGGLTDRPGCCASRQILGQPSGLPAVRWSGTQANASRASSASWG
jgi:hypothetical protein